MSQDKVINIEEQKMNREQRRALAKNTKKQKVKVSREELNEKGEEFIKYAEEQGVDLNAFFKMFSYWMTISTAQKEAVIVECVKQGKINLEETNNAEQSSESE